MEQNKNNLNVNSYSRPGVGIGVFVFDEENNKILLGKRIKEQKYGLPGGKLEYSESFEESAIRELFEETNILINQTNRLNITCTFNCFDKEAEYHWVVIYLSIIITKEEEQQLKTNELDKCEEWLWIDYDTLIKFKNNDQLFIPLQMFLNKYKIESFEQIKNLNSK